MIPFLPIVAGLLLQSADVTQLCPRPLEDPIPFVLIDYAEVEPGLFWTKWETKRSGIRDFVDKYTIVHVDHPLETDPDYEQIFYKNIKQEVEVLTHIVLEKWEDRRDPNYIDFKWFFTIKNYGSSKQNWWVDATHCNQVICPVPSSLVRGNIYWDWKPASEWYSENSTPEEYHLLEMNGIFQDQVLPEDLHNKEIQEYCYMYDWGNGRRTGDGFKAANYVTEVVTTIFKSKPYEREMFSGGTWGDLYFGCRRLSGERNKHWMTLDRSIEWMGEDWKWRVPEEENALIDLGVMQEYDPDFGLRFVFAMQGGSPIRYDANGDLMLPAEEWEWIPNVMEVTGHARFEMLDPEYPPDGSRCPWEQSQPYFDLEPDYSGDAISNE